MDFPDGLVTTNRKEIKYEIDMSRAKEIITSSRSILSRIFAPIYGIVFHHGNKPFFHTENNQLKTKKNDEKEDPDNKQTGIHPLFRRWTSAGLERTDGRTRWHRWQGVIQMWPGMLYRRIRRSYSKTQDEIPEMNKVCAEPSLSSETWYSQGRIILQYGDRCRLLPELAYFIHRCKLSCWVFSRMTDLCDNSPLLCDFFCRSKEEMIKWVSDFIDNPPFIPPPSREKFFPNVYWLSWSGKAGKALRFDRLQKFFVWKNWILLQEGCIPVRCSSHSCWPTNVSRIVSIAMQIHQRK